jgi:hypothetical protein
MAHTGLTLPGFRSSTLRLLGGSQQRRITRRQRGALADRKLQIDRNTDEHPGARATPYNARDYKKGERNRLAYGMTENVACMRCS